MHVPFFRPPIGDEEVGHVSAVLRSGWLTSGPAVAEFEDGFARAICASNAIAVNSCTAGLQAALLAHDVGPGDEVLTTPFTFCATVQAIEETGAQPVFVDIGDDLNLDCKQLEAAITSRTKAMLPVHVAGLSCDMNVIQTVAARHGLHVVEDAAHAFGAEWRGCPIGALPSSTTVFSFYANKNLTTGEGGIITTPNPDVAARLRLLIAHGIRYPVPDRRWQYDVVSRGLKCNLSDVLAAIGIEQLKKAGRHQSMRESIASFYAGALSGAPEIELPSSSAQSRHAWHLYMIRLRLSELEISRDEFVENLAKRGVACSVHFKPIPMHPWFARYGSMKRWPKAAAEFKRVVSLPIFPGMTRAEQEHVATQVREAVAACRKRVYSPGSEVHA